MERALGLLSEGLHPLLLALAGLATVLRMRRRGRLDLLAAAAFLVTCVLVTYLLGTGVFERARLLAWALFAYLPICLLGCAWVLRERSRRGAVVAGAAAFVTALVAVDALVLEPRSLEVNRVQLASSKVDRPLRIAIIADLQFDVFGDHERAVFARTMAERPDVVLLAGDYVQASGEERRRAEAELHAHLMSVRFSAPLGVYAVGGNVDDARWPALFADLPIEVFPETRTAIRERFAVTGLAVAASFDEHIRVAGTDRFHIALGHAPNFALGEVDADLLVAGHTHGGQFQLPFIGPLVTFSKVPRSWASGVTKLDGGRTLVVSRGTGMERGNAPRLRFNCRPEIVVVDVVPAT